MFSSETKIWFFYFLRRAETLKIKKKKIQSCFKNAFQSVFKNVFFFLIKKVVFEMFLLKYVPSNKKGGGGGFKREEYAFHEPFFQKKMFSKSVFPK